MVHLQLAAGCPNAPYVGLLRESPALAAAAFHGLIAEPLLPDADGFGRLPSRPGWGLEPREDLERVD